MISVMERPVRAPAQPLQPLRQPNRLARFDQDVLRSLGPPHDSAITGRLRPKNCKFKSCHPDATGQNFISAANRYRFEVPLFTAIAAVR